MLNNIGKYNKYINSSSNIPTRKTGGGFRIQFTHQLLLQQNILHTSHAVIHSSSIRYLKLSEKNNRIEMCFILTSIQVRGHSCNIESVN